LFSREQDNFILPKPFFQGPFLTVVVMSGGRNQEHSSDDNRDNSLLFDIDPAFSTDSAEL
jgi:hypothetical protein